MKNTVSMVMKNMVVVLAMVAMLGVSAVPAFAQIQPNLQVVDSGDSFQSFSVGGGGDNSNQCVGLSPVSNTGNNVNNLPVFQVGNLGSIAAPEGGDFTISPSNQTNCSQSVNQAASASG